MDCPLFVHNLCPDPKCSGKICSSKYDAHLVDDRPEKASLLIEKLAALVSSKSAVVTSIVADYNELENDHILVLESSERLTSQNATLSAQVKSLCSETIGLTRELMQLRANNLCGDCAQPRKAQDKTDHNLNRNVVENRKSHRGRQSKQTKEVDASGSEWTVV